MVIYRPILLMLAALFVVAPATAGYKKSTDGKCQVWAPSMLDKDEYPVRYTGACVDQRAEGRGRAEWLYLYADNKVKATWEGEFRNGVFIGDGFQKDRIEGRVEPISGDAYLVGAGKIKGAKLTFVASSPQDDALDMCLPKELILHADTSVDVTDDDQVKAVMNEGLRAFNTLCANRDKRPFIVSVYSADAPFKLTANGSFSEASAKSRYAGTGETLTWSYYTNSAADKARQQKQKDNYQAARVALQKKFESYSRQHQVAAWVTTRQLDENPFRWEGKTVGLCVQLSRMLTRDTALLENAYHRQGHAQVQVRGVTPDFPDSKSSVLLVAKVGKREALDGVPEKNAQFTTLQYVDGQRSQQANCGDWLGWQTSETQLKWDEPYSSNP